MLVLISFLVCLANLAAAQQISFPDWTGVRSLWIPFKTISGTPVASIAGNNSAANITTYVLGCPTASPTCSLSPNLTLTEGESFVGYDTTNSAGVATLGCDLTGTTSAVCSNVASGGGNVQRASTAVGADQIVFQAVDVTMTMNNTSTLPPTVTVSATPSTSSITSSSTAGAAPVSKGPLVVGGAVGAGLIALAAL